MIHLLKWMHRRVLQDWLSVLYAPTVIFTCDNIFSKKGILVLIYNFTCEITSQTLNKSKSMINDCEHNLSPMILKGNQMVYS